MLVAEPSPKLQNRLLIVPVEVSVNVTVNGAAPLVGVAPKLATGTIAPVPVTVLVEPPPSALLKITVLVNPFVLVGAKLTTTFAEAPPANVNGLPDTTLNGPPVTVANPLLTVVPPLLVTTNTRCDELTVATVPKSRLPGLTAIWPDVSPTPVTRLVEAPPLLLNTILLLQ